MKGLVAAMVLVAAVSSCGADQGGATGGTGGAPVPEPGAESIQEDGFELSWTVRGETVRVTMSAPGTGWLAVGFHTEGAMKNAQIAIGYVSDGVVSLRDDFGTGFTTHDADVELGGTDDLTVVSGSEEGGRTTITFDMPLSSGDAGDRVLTPGEQCRAILARGGDGDDSFTGYHAWAATVDIEI